MKISFMTFACANWPLEKVVDAAVRHDYQGIEFRCDAKHFHDVEVYTDKRERAAIRKRLERNNIRACCLATSLQFLQDEILEQAPDRIRLAADIGAPALRVFCGPNRLNLDPPVVVQTVAERLRQLGDLAEQQGVQLWLETHDTFSKAADAAAAVRAAAHPAVFLNYDILHPWRMGESVAATFTQIQGLVRHCHFHDGVADAESLTVTPFGKGQVPLDDIFTRLVQSGYTGYLSGEWFGDNYGPDPDEALARFHRDVTDLAGKHGVKIG